MISAALEKLSKSASYLSMFIYANVTLSDMPWDVVEERERVRLRKEKRGDLGRERGRGKRWDFMGRKVPLYAAICGRRFVWLLGLFAV